VVGMPLNAARVASTFSRLSRYGRVVTRGTLSFTNSCSTVLLRALCDLLQSCLQTSTPSNTGTPSSSETATGTQTPSSSATASSSEVSRDGKLRGRW
jgi:hypothetical protein